MSTIATLVASVNSPDYLLAAAQARSNAAPAALLLTLGLAAVVAGIAAKTVAQALASLGDLLRIVARSAMLLLLAGTVCVAVLMVLATRVVEIPV